MRLVEKIIMESGDVASTFEFKVDRDDSDNMMFITALYDGDIAGKISFEFDLADAVRYHFQEEISEEEYGSLVGDLDDHVGYIHKLEVDEYFRQSGLGSHLMRLAMGELGKCGVTGIFLNACPIGFQISLSALVSFYQKNGFKVVAHQGGNAIMFKKV